MAHVFEIHLVPQHLSHCLGLALIDDFASELLRHQFLGFLAHKLIDLAQVFLVPLLGLVITVSCQPRPKLFLLGENLGSNLHFWDAYPVEVINAVTELSDLLVIHIEIMAL